MKRALKVPTKQISKAEFRKLQDEMDARLRASGFVDIEYGRDLNDFDASTFRGHSDEGGHGIEVSLWDAFTFSDSGENGNQDLCAYISDADQFKLWSMFAQKANDLPGSDVWRSFMIELAECGGIREASRRLGVSPFAAERAVRRFCAANEIDYSKLLSACRPSSKPEETKPARVRKLSKREIRTLGYMPPKLIGAHGH